MLLIMLCFALVGVAYYVYAHKRTLLKYWWQDVTRDKIPFTLLLGSSSIARLPANLLVDCRNPILYGFHNGTTESISQYLAISKAFDASKIVLYIGENDIAHGEAYQDTFAQLTQIIQTIHTKTDAKIGLVKLKYSPVRVSVHADIQAFNTLLENTYGSSIKVELIPFDRFSNPNLFLQDGVHLNAEGTRIFAPLINQFCKESE